MTEKTTTDAGQTSKPAGKAGMVGLAVVALIASFGASYLLTPTPSVAAVEACDISAKGNLDAPPVRRTDQAYVPLEEVLITIGSEPATRYLKMNVSVVTGKDEQKSVQSAEPVLRDAFLTYLRSVELSEFEDPSFYSHMREQLARRSELVLGASVSDGVLVTEFLLR